MHARLSAKIEFSFDARNRRGLTLWLDESNSTPALLETDLFVADLTFRGR